MEPISKHCFLACGCNVFSQLSVLDVTKFENQCSDLAYSDQPLDCLARKLSPCLIVPTLCELDPDCRNIELVPTVNGMFAINSISETIQYRGFCDEPSEMCVLSYRWPKGTSVDDLVVIGNTSICDSFLVCPAKLDKGRTCSKDLHIFAQGGALNVINLQLEEGDEIGMLSLSFNEGILVTKKNRLFRVRLLQEFQELDLSPVPFSSSITIQSVSCGYEHVVMVAGSGLVFAFGGNSRGQLGTGTLDACQSPCIISDLEPLRMILAVAGGWHTLALAQSGDIYGWGWNESGQVGVNSDSGRSIQVVVSPELVDTPLEEVFVSLSAGSRHSAAVTNQGFVYTWGWNGYGQLGHGDQNIRLQPCKVKVPHIVTECKCKGFSTFLKCAC